MNFDISQLLLQNIVPVIGFIFFFGKQTTEIKSLLDKMTRLERDFELKLENKQTELQEAKSLTKQEIEKLNHKLDKYTEDRQLVSSSLLTEISKLDKEMAHLRQNIAFMDEKLERTSSEVTESLKEWQDRLNQFLQFQTALEEARNKPRGRTTRQTKK